MRGSASASRIAVKDSGFQDQAQLARGAAPFEQNPGEREPRDRQDPGAVEGHKHLPCMIMTLFSTG